MVWNLYKIKLVLGKSIAPKTVKENGTIYIEKNINLFVNTVVKSSRLWEPLSESIVITCYTRDRFWRKEDASEVATKILELKKVNNLPMWLKDLLLSDNEE